MLRYWPWQGTLSSLGVVAFQCVALPRNYQRTSRREVRDRPFAVRRAIDAQRPGMMAARRLAARGSRPCRDCDFEDLLQFGSLCALLACALVAGVRERLARLPPRKASQQALGSLRPLPP